jgi:protein phosphatase
VALTDVGRKRSNNQDYLGDLIFKSGRKYGPEKLNERGHLFAVADGMGGYAGGEVASELAITTLFERYYNGTSSGDIGTDLSDAIKAANLKVHTEASGSGRPQMGTTLTTVLVKGNKAIFGNVGDSRTYLIRQGLAERVTHDHSLVQDQIDAGVLTPEQAERSAIKNFITRAIGHRDDVESDLFEREIQPGDVLLLCSDGLHGLVKEQEMGTIVATAPAMQEAAQELVNLANERGGPDNISVMLIKVEDIGEALPNILKGREPIYNSNRHLFNQTTEPLGAVSASAATTVSQADRVTVPSPVPVPAAMSSAYSQPTAQIATISEPEPKKGRGRGLVLGIIGLLVVAAIAVIVFILLSGQSNPVPAATATAQPRTAAATPTVTAAPATTAAQTTVAALPTATPPAAAGAPAPTNGSAAGLVSGTTPAASADSGDRNPRGTVGPTEDQSNSASFTNCPATTPKDGLRCWQIQNMGQIRTIRVTLANPTSGLTLRLQPPSTSSAVTIPFNLETGSATTFEATGTLLPGRYSLVITRPNATGTPESYDVLLENNPAQIWGTPEVQIRQDNDTLIILINNKL